MKEKMASVEQKLFEGFLHKPILFKKKNKPKEEQQQQEKEEQEGGAKKEVVKKLFSFTQSQKQ